MLLVSLVSWCGLVFWACGGAGANSIVIKSGVQKDQGQTQGENLEDVQFHKGIANYEGAEGFNNNGEAKVAVAKDSGRYGEHSADKNTHLDANNYNNQNFHQNGGEHLGNVDSKVAHKKGHHKAGFHNSYHKDETGSNSSYFDDGSDEGDELVHKRYKGAYGDAGQNQHNGGKYDSREFAKDQGRQGYYDNEGKYLKDHGNREGYNRNNYYNNKEDYGRRNSGNNYQGGGRYAEEKYIERPHYHHHPQPLPYYREEPYRVPIHLPQKPHITIYEDPRYVRSDPRYRRSDDYSDDYIDIEYRSPLLDREQFVTSRGRIPDYYY
ncbi:GATA zinc finger domain-containing protein 14-like [Sitophilus oryzae]|uniref:GATA zinc finger domain-containing protein 14-like n=1 Tax=Sitophilus oryzae TaxID=7048 RepID=A0A6J2XB45_SITOR|nr:GATA zinc finger domain-containing protein 14-like [Sitophilus oryzae]